MSEPDLGLALLSHARAAIARRLELPVGAPLAHPALDAPGATFVTLTRHGVLRGCIGQLVATRSLLRDVEENAQAAAFHDPRFPPLTRAEWDGLAVEVSVLGEAHYHACPRIENALALIEPGRDGVILSAGGRRATFLPQVWAQLPQARDFLAQLQQKAGLGHAWPADMQIGLYRVDKYVEPAA